MKNLFALILGCVVLVGFIGCGGGSSTPAPTPTPTPSQVFPNDTSTAQSAPVKLATSGGNANDLGTKVCCIGTLGSLWTKTGVTNPVILSNNHVLDRSGNGVAGEAIDQPLQLVCTPPGSPAPLTVANLTQGAALKPVANEPGQCPGSTAPLCGHAPSNVDAAIAEIVSGEVDPSGALLDTGAVGSTSIAAAPPSSNIGTPALTEAVSKSGRTTGLTCSTIQSLNTTVQIDYDAKCGDTTPAFTALFVNQVTINGGSFSSSGDSGSLVIDTGTARAVALLYGGNTTSTVANPIQDVITAFGGPAAFKIVGAGDHAVSCAKTASAGSLQVGAAQSTLVPAERQRVAAVQQRHAASLMRDFNLSSVEAGASADSPSEGALVLHVSGKTALNVPAVIDGVRTRLVFDHANTQPPSVTAQQINSAIAVKEAHVGDFMGHTGIQGIGVSVSADDPAESAISIYVIKGSSHQAIPATIDGVRTRVFEGDRFKAY